MIYLFIILMNFAYAAPSELITACVKGAKQELKNKQKACECSVEKTYKLITTGDYQNKNPEKRIAWFKAMLEGKLTQAEIDEDKYSIWEFNYHHTTECLTK